MTRLLTVLASGPEAGRALMEVHGFTRADISGAVNRGLVEVDDQSVPYAQRVFSLTPHGQETIDPEQPPPRRPAAPPPPRTVTRAPAAVGHDYSGAPGPLVEEEGIDLASLTGIGASFLCVAVQAGLVIPGNMPVLVEARDGELLRVTKVQLWTDPEDGQPCMILGL